MRASAGPAAAPAAAAALVTWMCTVSALLPQAQAGAVAEASSGGGRCPNLCSRNGVCTRGVCRCYLGFSGADCSHQRGGSAGPAPMPSLKSFSGSGAPLRILVVTTQTNVDDDVDAVIPGLATARLLAADGHDVSLLFLLHNEDDKASEAVWSEELRRFGVEMDLIYKTRHYYLPAHLAHSFEAFAWLCDRKLKGLPGFHTILFHDSHGLGYFTTMAKHQDIQAADLGATQLVVRLELPHLWLINQGGGAGISCVDDLEVNFIERRTLELADHVLVPSPAVQRWAAERAWNISGTVHRLPRALPVDGVHRPAGGDAGGGGAGSGAGEGGGAGGVPVSPAFGAVTVGSTGPLEVVFLVEGPGGGGLGLGVSSGGHQTTTPELKEREVAAKERDRIQYVVRDVDLVCGAAEALVARLARERGVALPTDGSALPPIDGLRVVFFLLGNAGGTHPPAVGLIQKRAAGGGGGADGGNPRWEFWWQVVRGPTSAALQYVQEAPRTVVLPAVSHRGSNTVSLFRRLLAVADYGGADGGEGAMRLLVASPDASKDVLLDYLAPESAGLVVRAEPGAVADAVAAAHANPGAAPKARRAPEERYDHVAHRALASSLRPELAGGGGGAGGSAGGGAGAAPGRVAAAAAARVAALAAQDVHRSTGAAAEMYVKSHWGAQGEGVAAAADESWWSTHPPPMVTVVITHYNRPKLLPLAVHSVALQDYPQDRLQLVVVDDGSPQEDVPQALDELEEKYRFEERGWTLLREPNRYLGGARNRGFREAKGKYVLFMDDDNCAKPFEVSVFARAMESGGADMMTSHVDFVWGQDMPPVPKPAPQGTQAATAETLPEGQRASPSFVFLGGSAEVGVFKNCFGDANSFFRASSFASLGGYTEDRNIGYEDWELYSKAVLEGYTLEVVPLALYHYRFTGGSMQKSTSYSKSRRRALRAYQSRLEGRL